MGGDTGGDTISLKEGATGVREPCACLVVLVSGTWALWGSCGTVRTVGLLVFQRKLS